nr:flagellin-like protein [uncultured bacterium]
MNIQAITGNTTNQSGVTASSTALKDHQRLSEAQKAETASHAALLALSAQTTANAQAVGQSIKNLNDTISSAHIAEAGINAIRISLLKLHDLAIQGSSPTISTSDRQNLQAQATNIQQHIAEVVNSTQYNGTTLLAPSSPDNPQTSGSTASPISMTMPDLSGAIPNISLSSATGAQNALVSISQNLNQINAAQSDLESSSALFSSLSEALISAQSASAPAGSQRILNSDLAQAVASSASATIRSQANLAIITQANQSPAQVQSLL